MKIKNVAGMLLGTCVVYVSMAACSSGDRIQFATGGAGGSNGTGMMHSSTGMGMGGAIGMGGMGGFMEDDGGSIFDALTDPVPNASADPVSGTRLKAKYIKAEDGARAPIIGTWYDSQRNEDCYFQRAADGQQHCLPMKSMYISYYADASCTQPVIYAANGCAPPDYGIGYVFDDSCGTAASAYYPVDSAIALTEVYYASSGNCGSTSVLSGYTYYTLGSAIPLSAFVAGNVEVDP